jgi:hypothetical protein
VILRAGTVPVSAGRSQDDSHASECKQPRCAIDIERVVLVDIKSHNELREL